MSDDDKEKPKIDSNALEASVRKALARGEILWKLIGENDFSAALGFALKRGTPFDELDDGDKLRIVKVSNSFIKASDEIEKAFTENQIEKEIETEEKAQINQEVTAET
jgi:hypothetical protein